MADDSDNQYFTSEPTSSSAPRQVALELPDASVRLASDAGVFSADRVDPGTRTLLIEVPQPAASVRTALDLGCGYGPITVTLARRAPQATVWGVDVNPRAVALCRRNADDLGLTNVSVALPDDVDPAIEFDEIWSNPPIRIGKPALHDLLDRWIGRLRPGGHAYLVVHKHLGSDSLQRWLTERFGPTERLTSRAGYRMLDVVRRPAEDRLREESP